MHQIIKKINWAVWCFLIAGSAQASDTFIATNSKSFEKLMVEAMMRMHQEMGEATLNKNPDHDFVTQMIPHHQGAIDMAKVLLLYGKDQTLRNLAQQIITDQQTEINLMNVWLTHHPDTAKEKTK